MNRFALIFVLVFMLPHELRQADGPVSRQIAASANQLDDAVNRIFRPATG